jgi:hypothetical protein
MKYLKKFENVHDSDLSLKYFFDKYYGYKKIYTTFDTKVTNLINNFDIPKMFYDDIFILYFLYKERFFWTKNIKKEDEYTKMLVKKYVLNSILKKFEKDPLSYISLKSTLNKRKNFNDIRSFGYIGNAIIKYIFFLLTDAVKKAPDWLKDTEKYNI